MLGIKQGASQAHPRVIHGVKRANVKCVQTNAHAPRSPPARPQLAPRSPPDRPQIASLQHLHYALRTLRTTSGVLAIANKSPRSNAAPQLRACMMFAL